MKDLWDDYKGFYLMISPIETVQLTELKKEQT